MAIIRFDEEGDDREQPPPTPGAYEPEPTQTPAGDLLGRTTEPPVIRQDWPTENVELYQGIEDLYKKYLQRTPAQHEVVGHLPNPGGLSGVERTILDSPEYRALTGGTGGPEDPGAPDPSDYWHWFKQLTVNKGLRANSDTLKSLESVLARYNIRVLTNAEGISGKIQLPNGQIIDVIRAAGAGGGGPDYWQWDAGGGTGGGPPPSGTPPGGIGNIPPWGTPLAESQYDDPYTLQMEELIKSRMAQLMQPIDNPYINQYGDLLQGRISGLQGYTPELQGLMDALNKRITDLGSMDEYAKQLKERNESLRGTTESLQKLMDFASRRAEELKGPEYTGAQQEIFRTQALDPIERDRTAAKQRVLANLASRGLDLNSGIAQAALNEADRAYDALRASAQGDIAAGQAESYSQRQDQVMRILQALAEIPELRADQALAVMQELQQYLTGREQEGLKLRGTLADIPEQRASQAVGFAGELAQLSDFVRRQQNQRAAEAIALSGQLSDLGPQRLQAALAALGQGESPQGVFGNLATLAGLQQTQQGLGIQSQANQLSGLGQTLGYLFGSLPQRSNVLPATQWGGLSFLPGAVTGQGLD